VQPSQTELADQIGFISSQQGNNMLTVKIQSSSNSWEIIPCLRASFSEDSSRMLLTHEDGEKESMGIDDGDRVYVENMDGKTVHMVKPKD
jgi:hypothetical protein